MADMEKIISNFEHEVNKAHGEGWDFVDLSTEDAKKILSLLKEHEPIQIKLSEDYGTIKFGECPKCKSFINNRGFPKSCGCGKAVKRE